MQKQDRAAGEALRDEILKEAELLSDSLVQNRRRLHEQAETGFELSGTVQIVKNALEELGIRPIDCGKNGIVAQIQGKTPGKVFLLRADMDARPVGEETGVPFAAKNGNMHACGHDLHTAMLLGAAKILKARENQLKGTV